MSRAPLLPGYERVRRGGVEAFAWHAVLPWLESVLSEAGSRWTVHAWAARRSSERPDAGPPGGRAPVHVVAAPAPGPDGRAAWVVRRYRRGGLAAPLLGERYVRLGPPRPERELTASALARARGIRTPAVVAGATYRGGGASGLLYRAELVTELVPGAASLAAALFGPDAFAPPDRVRALAQAGRLVRDLAEAGLAHADLNAGNVLVGGAGEDAWVVDLDRCRVLAPAREPGSVRDTGARAATMLRRLERSLAKLGRATGRPLAATEWTALRAAFREGL